MILPDAGHWRRRETGHGVGHIPLVEECREAQGMRLTDLGVQIVDAGIEAEVPIAVEHGKSIRIDPSFTDCIGPNRGGNVV